MSFQKSSEARQAARSRALLDGPVPGERATRHRSGALLSVEHSLSKLPRSVNGAATAHARAGADARPLRVSPVARAVAARGLGAREEAMLSPLYRRGAGASAKASVATCHRR